MCFSFCFGSLKRAALHMAALSAMCICGFAGSLLLLSGWRHRLWLISHSKKYYWLICYKRKTLVTNLANKLKRSQELPRHVRAPAPLPRQEENCSYMPTSSHCCRRDLSKGTRYLRELFCLAAMRRDRQRPQYVSTWTRMVGGSCTFWPLPSRCSARRKRNLAEYRFVSEPIM